MEIFYHVQKSYSFTAEQREKIYLKAIEIVEQRAALKSNDSDRCKWLCDALKDACIELGYAGQLSCYLEITNALPEFISLKPTKAFAEHRPWWTYSGLRGINERRIALAFCLTLLRDKSFQSSIK